MVDSSEIDAALLARLSSDPTLASLMPGGVWLDLAPPQSTAFVIVALLDATDVDQFGSRAWEEGLYLVKAVALSTVPNAHANVNAAAARIDALLEGDPVPLTAPGYVGMILRRRGGRIAKTEVDDLDKSIRWYHGGAEYECVMSAGAT